MNTIKKYIVLFNRYTYMSALNILQFPFNIFMKTIDVFFRLVFLYTFWYSLKNLNVVIPGWNNIEIMILVSFTFFSKALDQFGFGFRDIEYSVIDGTFDKYLTKPIHAVFSILFENFFIFWVVSQTIVFIIMFSISVNLGNYSLKNLLPALIILILGTLVYNLIYGCISLLTFWFGRVDSLRSIIFSVNSGTKYPLDIFPKNVFSFFTWIIPISFLSTIPTMIFTEKIENYNSYLFGLIVLIILWSIIFKILWKKALSKYESTGN